MAGPARPPEAYRRALRAVPETIDSRPRLPMSEVCTVTLAVRRGHCHGVLQKAGEPPIGFAVVLIPVSLWMRLSRQLTYPPYW
jgi:hypothetical protein